MHDWEYVLGIDIGGTKMEVALVRFEGLAQFEIKKRQRIPTERDSGIDSILQRLAQLCREVAASAPGGMQGVAAIGIALPGTVDPQSERMIIGNSKVFAGVDLKEKLKKLLNFEQPIRCANDANCFALAETLLGVGPKHAQKHSKKQKDLVGLGVILGTGVGGGLIIENKIFAGKSGSAAEIGHTQMLSAHHVEKCYCGGVGHAEQFLAGSSLEKFYQQAYGEAMKSADIFNAADDSKHPKHGPCAQLIETYQDDLSTFLANLTNAYDPDFIVLGGGVSLQSSLYKKLEDRVWKKCFNPRSRPDIYQNVLGDSAGVIGAALLF